MVRVIGALHAEIGVREHHLHKLRRGTLLIDNVASVSAVAAPHINRGFGNLTSRFRENCSLPDSRTSCAICTLEFTQGAKTMRRASSDSESDRAALVKRGGAMVRSP